MLLVQETTETPTPSPEITPEALPLLLLDAFPTPPAEIYKSAECYFSDPLYVKKTGEQINYIPPDNTNQNFQFSKITCYSAYGETITSTSSSASFFLNKSFSYGDLVVIFLIVSFAIVIITKAVADFIFKAK